MAVAVLLNSRSLKAELGPRQAEIDARPDSTSYHRDARELQARFERHRIRELPHSLGGSAGECEDVIGRLCIWDGADDSWTPPPEPEPIRRERDRLLDSLAVLARRIPGDRWILGQRVRYTVESGRLPEAEAIASSCRMVERWRCDAYLGFVRHHRGDIPGASTAFQEALAAMPPETRAEWTRLDPILDTDLGGWLREQNDFAQAEAWIWVLADPLFLVDGNDRWTGHLSRWTYAMSSERARSPHQLSWGSDLTEAVVRYGWPIAWEKPWPRPGELSSRSAIGHDPPTAVRMLPPRDVLDPGDRDPVLWTLRREYAASVYLPPYLDSLGVLDAQVGRFWRGNDVVVVASATAPTPEPIEMKDPSVRVGLFIAGQGAVVGSVRDTLDPGGEIRLATRAEGTVGGLVSLEAWGPEMRKAYRMRWALELEPRPRDVVAISDLVLLAEGTEPASFEALLDAMRPSTTVPPDKPLGVAFEAYGLGLRSEVVRFSARIEGDQGGFLTRTARWLRLADPAREVAVEWSEPGPERPEALFRAFQIGLPGLTPGDYELVLEVSTQGRSTVERRRRFAVSEAGSPR